MAGIIVTLIALAWQSDNLTQIYLGQWGRRVFYPDNSGTSDYPGRGSVIQTSPARILIAPKGEGRPKYGDPSEQANYPSDKYNITLMPSQEKLVYALGRLDKWVEIEGSTDKYIVIKNTESGKLEQYRVAMDNARLAVERVGREGDDTVINLIEKPKVSKISEIGDSAMAKILRRGDSVIVFPQFAPPVWAKQDESGYYITESIMVRRAGGAEAINTEIDKWGGK